MTFPPQKCLWFATSIRRTVVITSAWLLSVVIVTASAHASSEPFAEKPIKLIVSFDVFKDLTTFCEIRGTRLSKAEVPRRTAEEREPQPRLECRNGLADRGGRNAKNVSCTADPVGEARKIAFVVQTKLGAPSCFLRAVEPEQYLEPPAAFVGTQFDSFPTGAFGPKKMSVAPSEFFCSPGVTDEALDEGISRINAWVARS
jgi:hypothetical protein